MSIIKASVGYWPKKSDKSLRKIEMGIPTCLSCVCSPIDFWTQIVQSIALLRNGVFPKWSITFTEFRETDNH